MLMRSTLRFGIAILLQAHVANADEAEHARVVLDYSTAPDIDNACPSRDAFASAIATRLGYEAVVADDKEKIPQRLNVEYTKRDRAVVVRMRLLSTSGELLAEKTLTSETGACAEVGTTAAFSAAILIDPRAMFGKRADAATPPPASLPPEPPSRAAWPWYEPPADVHPPAPPPKAVEPWRWHGGLAGTTCFGCGPAPSVGANLFAGFSKGALALEIGGRAFLETSAAASSGRSVAASLVTFDLFPHARFGLLRAGAFASVGALFGQSDGERQTSLWSSAGVRAALDFHVTGAFFLRASLDGGVVLGRVALRVESIELWSTPPVVGGGSLGAGAEF